MDRHTQATPRDGRFHADSGTRAGWRWECRRGDASSGLRRAATARCLKMARESPGQTLQPTALVHEAWLGLGGDDQPNWQNRSHFLGAAAEAMRGFWSKMPGANCASSAGAATNEWSSTAHDTSGGRQSPDVRRTPSEGLWQRWPLHSTCSSETGIAHS